MTTSSKHIGLDRLIDRPMLRSALDEAFERRLTLITAQAGAGKTTLLRQWSAAHSEHEFVFLDVDAADDDPVHFARRFISALAVVDPTIVGLSQPAVSRDRGLGAALVAAVTAVLAAMPDVVIIVDNVQRFSNVLLVADLGKLIEQVPHNVHLVFSSRFDPPIALSRYRLDHELLELRQSELAFTERESAQLLERIIGHPLAGPQVRAIRERTEGWAAGLQLAGLNLKHEMNPDRFIAEFGGSDRLVADYLGEEVLAYLPSERRELLLQLSALDDMSASLVESAIGCADAQSVLEGLEHESMFLVPLDTHREWFRFHTLFRELLRSRLAGERPAEELRILLAAAEWHLARGKAKTAVEYLLRAQTWDRALETIFSIAADVVARGDMLTVVRWMLRVPEPVRSERISEELFAGALRAVARQPEPLTANQGRILRTWLAAGDDAQLEATRQLTGAVKVAESRGLVGVAPRGGPLVLERIATASGLKGALSATFRAPIQRYEMRSPPPALAEPLTDRELEILAYLPTRFSNTELAARCFVSVNTIKTHMAHIYRKLEVTTRDAAIDRARQLGLLSGSWG